MLCHTHCLYCHGENVEEKGIHVCLGSIIHMYIFLYSDSVTFLSFVFVLQKKIIINNSDKVIRRPRGLLSMLTVI